MTIWSLFDGSGIMGLPWALAGHEVYCFNADDADHGDYNNVKCENKNIKYINVWIDDEFAQSAMNGQYGKPDLIFAFPPCTDLAVSGAAHFASKAILDPEFQEKAVKTARWPQVIADFFYVPYMIENPIGVISSMWRKPDFIFHPYEYGGYLPEDDVHPSFPDYIKQRDSYPKKTCIWSGNGFLMPDKKAVHVFDGYSEQHNRLGGKSKKTKLIRSLTPRGFARAVYEANK